MKDFSKVEEAKRLLEESGVDYVIANKAENERGWWVNASLTPRDFLNAIETMVNGLAKRAKEAGVTEEHIGMQCLGAVVTGIQKGYGTFDEMN